MALTHTGVVGISRRLIGAEPIFTESNTYLGVGDSNLLEDPTQTDLLGGQTFRKIMDAGFPTVDANGIMTFRATFDVNEAAFPWEEWGIFDAPVGGRMLCRITESNGTKLANQVWVFLVTVELETE